MVMGGGALVAGWLGLAAAGLVDGKSAADAQLRAKQTELARLQTQIVAMKSSVNALEGDVAARAAKLEARQAFLANLLSGRHDTAQLAALLPRSRDQADARALLTDNQAAMLEPFRRLEREQLAFVDKATGAAEARLKDTQALLRRLNLDPRRFTAQSDIRFGSGGPYVPVSAPADVEPAFKSLYTSWHKLEALEQALAVVPSYVPVKSFSYTSGFGVRYDPFTGNSAVHAGIDMAGAHGAPIYAAADGVVTTAGRRGAYGNCIDLNHGKGIETRYGHLSEITVAPGTRVRQGDVIGKMGSTGRSTGTHLHYEVRVDGRAVNPRPFLEASTFMLAAQRRAPAELPRTFEALPESDLVVASLEPSAGSPRMTPINLD